MNFKIILSLCFAILVTSNIYAYPNCEPTQNWTTNNIPSGCPSGTNCYDPGNGWCTDSAGTWNGSCGNTHTATDPTTGIESLVCCTGFGCTTHSGAMGSGGTGLDVSHAAPLNPFLLIKSPADKFAFKLGTDVKVMVDVSSVAPGITKVEFYKNRVLVGTVTPSAAPLSTTASQTLRAASLAVGSYVIEVKAYDEYGRVGASSVSFTVSK